MTRLQHQLHAVVFPLDDLPGKWGIICLELDIMTHGDSPAHAVEMLDDAIRCVADARIEDGLPPLDFRSAPAEDWERLKGAEPISTHLLAIPGGEIEENATITPHLFRRAG